MSYSVSIITPSFNQGCFIGRTIQSVLNQGIEDLEYLVFDGASTDDTIDILRRYEPQVKWISETDRGQAHAVNKGLARCQGEIIGWLNSDDIYYPNAIHAVCRVFEANPDIDLVYGKAYHIDEKDGVIEQYETRPWDFNALKEVCYLCQPAVFFRRRVVDKAGPLDEHLHYCMDYEYWLRLAQRGLRFHYVPEVLAGSRLYATTKTISDRVKVHDEINSMFQERLGRVPDRWIHNYAHAVLGACGLNPRHRLLFALGASALSWYASLRWLKSVPKTIRSTTLQWIIGSAKTTIREMTAR